MTPIKSQMIAAILAFVALATGADAARRQAGKRYQASGVSAVLLRRSTAVASQP